MDIQAEIERRFKLQTEYLGESKPVNKITPLVSVSVATYQHAPYIRECLDSILNQETNFPFEIIIGEDESVDGTREICIEYAEKFPDKIRLFLRDREISHLKDENGKLIKRLNGIFTFGLMSSRGKYIALCEGDDYWTGKMGSSDVVGVPAKKIKMRFEEHIIKELLEIKWRNWPIELIREHQELLFSTNLDAKSIEKIRQIGNNYQKK